MPRRLWAPAAASRERTAATALLLVLVIGAANATRGDIWPAPNLLKHAAPAAAVQAVASIPYEPCCAAAPRAPLAATPARAQRVRSVVDAELPPVRAPDWL